MKLELLGYDDVAEAYGLLVARTEELIARGTGQYTGPFPPFEVYRQRIDRGQNWGARVKGRLGGIVSLMDGGMGSEWPEAYRQERHLWLASLFVGPDFKGRGLGEKIIDDCKAMAGARGLPIYLDCYLDSGFLEPYYRARGFVLLDTKLFVYGERSFGAALMRYPALPGGDRPLAGVVRGTHQ